MSSIMPQRRFWSGAVALPEMLPSNPADDLLSEREHQVAELVARGLSNKEIALELEISPWTVSAHLRRVFTKLGITRRMELCLLLRASALYRA